MKLYQCKQSQHGGMFVWRGRFSKSFSPSCSVLCSDRVGQVTKTYHDIKAVTHLLEEVQHTQPRSR